VSKLAELIPAGVMTRTAGSWVLRCVTSTRLPTRWGEFQVIGFERESRDETPRVETAVVLALGEIADNTPLLRIHSQCLTGDVFGSLRCDCGEQLELAMRTIASEGSGLLIYENQEGRGIGLMAKLQAYSLQDTGLDTIEANHALGFVADARDFGLPVMILQELGIRRVRLLTNNPQKSRAVDDAGIEVIERIPCEAEPNAHSLAYLQAKKERMGHSLSFTEPIDFNSVLHHYSGGAKNRRIPNWGPDPDHSAFVSIEDAIRELQAGRIIVVVDDEDRENEGDLTMAAEMITPEAINFMATHGRGLICLAMTGERLDELALRQMAHENNSLHGTAFAVSIDAVGHGVTTGVSAHDRAQTIQAAVNGRSGPQDFARPGHVFPLRARPGGVLERRGQTEASVDLARLAGLHPSGVICEILNEDGTMARVPDLIEFCQTHDLKMTSVAELARYRMKTDTRTIQGVV
jgi:3,4-dihydroxy-2-butanone 4-phosphate synthase/GTP cyclohydrolase II